jgi:hypothetical protein
MVTGYGELVHHHPRPLFDLKNNRSNISDLRYVVVNFGKSKSVLPVDRLHLEGGVIDVRLPLPSLLKSGKFIRSRFAEGSLALGGVPLEQQFDPAWLTSRLNRFDLEIQ